jgi:hypothetical protein
MIAIAMIVAPAPGKITFAVSEATRSLGAFWIALNGSVAR